MLVQVAARVQVLAEVVALEWVLDWVHRLGGRAALSNQGQCHLGSTRDLIGNTTLMVHMVMCRQSGIHRDLLAKEKVLEQVEVAAVALECPRADTEEHHNPRILVQSSRDLLGNTNFRRRMVTALGILLSLRVLSPKHLTATQRNKQ